MPRITRRNRNKRKDLQEIDDTESESGKLSETQEVARRLSRTRLGKENASRVTHQGNSKKKGPSDPYDADSEVESDINIQPDMDSHRSPMTPMITDNISESSSLNAMNPRITALHNQMSMFQQDHSTPSTMTPGQSDESLYGFAAVLNSPLPFSPVSGTPYLPSSPSGSINSLASSLSTSISPGKRKLQLRVFDMPIERPSKRAKKKKSKQIKQEIPQNDITAVHADFDEEFPLRKLNHTEKSF